MLITLTGPTASGKTYLRDHLIANYGFQGLVSTTTREMRPGEAEGREYYYISKELSASMLANGAFIEHFTYNGVTYGITEDELQQRLNTRQPVLAILTPEGVHEFEWYCADHGIEMRTIYVDVPAAVRVDRLTSRIADELTDIHTTAGAWNQGKVRSILRTYLNRFNACGPLGNEQNWLTIREWDLVVSGESLVGTVEPILELTRNR